MRPMLSVAVVTYNQEKYISQTLASILSQKHRYTYEIIVGDDCSADRTGKIIAEYASKYPAIIRPIYNEKNLGFIKNYFNVINHCKGKYIMECAGDDWWLPGKVAKQIEFMETHDDVGMCYGRAEVWNEKTLTRGGVIGHCKNTTSELLVENAIPAVSVCFRNEIIKTYMNEIQPQKKTWKMEDYPFWLYISHESRIHFFADNVAVYRLLEESESHSLDRYKRFEFENSTNEIRLFFAEKYNLQGSLHIEKIILFYIGVLKQNYRKEYAIKLKECYRLLPSHTMKMKMYNICAFMPCFWRMVKQWNSIKRFFLP